MPQKGIPALLEALTIAKADVPDLDAVIVGDGPHRADYEALVSSTGAEGWVRFMGRVADDELVDWYRRAWLVASASQREGFGLTLTEAAACGTPTVATRIPGHVDAVDDGVSGLLATGTAELGAAIARVLLDHDLRAALVAGALQHGRQFRWDASAAALLGALCDDAERHR
jgi:glycosyltransferase involved in cell wall biosynthesis